MVEYIFPTQLLDYYTSVALNNFRNERHIETLCIALGSEAGNAINIEELIFPTQSGTSNSVDDEGN